MTHLADELERVAGVLSLLTLRDRYMGDDIAVLRRAAEALRESDAMRDKVNQLLAVPWNERVKHQARGDHQRADACAWVGREMEKVALPPSPDQEQPT